MREFIDIVENVSQSNSNNLMDRFNGKVYRFTDLPQEGKNAIEVYYGEFGDIDPDEQWGYAIIPTDALKQAIGGNDEFDSFEEYHRDYIRGGTENHPSVSHAVILNIDPRMDEVLLDGWHRFHDYVHNGAEMIPAIIPLD